MNRLTRVLQSTLLHPLGLRPLAPTNAIRRGPAPQRPASPSPYRFAALLLPRGLRPLAPTNAIRLGPTPHRAASPSPYRFAALLLALTACGPDARPRAADPRDLRTLSEGRALEVIEQVGAEAGVTMQSNWPVVLGGRDPISVDERIGTTSFGLEFVNPQDRADHDDVFPEPRDDGQLLLIEGRGQDQSARVLVLDHRNYRYDPDLERVQRGAVGVREAEARLRRDIRDFLEHVRAEGAL